MIGLSRTPRASSSRPLATGPRTGLGVAPSLTTLSLAALSLAALGAVGCESALADGNPEFTDNPFASPNSNGTTVTPGNNPPGQGGPTEQRYPTLSTIQNNGPTVDENGAPLPPEMLAPLTMCGTPGPRQIRRLTSQQYRNTLVAVFGGDQGVPDAPVL